MTKQVKRLIMSLCGCAAAVAGLLTTSAGASADIKAPSYIPTIDIFPTATFVTGEDAHGLPGAFGAPGGLPLVEGDVKFNGVFSQPLLNHLAFQYEYDRASGIDNSIGNITNQLGTQVVGGTSNDIINEFRLAYSQPQIGVILGHYYRFRNCCPNTAQAGDPNNSPIDWHATYLQVGLTTPKIKALNGATLGVTERTTYNLHHVTADRIAALAALGIPDRDGRARFAVNYGANINVPVNSGFSLFASYSFGAFDFFDNIAPYPFYYDISDFGFTKKINKYLSATADVNNLVQQNLSNGVPFTYPNAIHRIYLATGLDIHLGP